MARAIRSFRLWALATAIALTAVLGMAGSASAGEGFDKMGPDGVIHVYTYERGDFGSYKNLQVQTSFIKGKPWEALSSCRTGGSVTWTDPTGVQRHRDTVNNDCVPTGITWQDFYLNVKKGTWVYTWERVDGVWYGGPQFQVE